MPFLPYTKPWVTEADREAVADVLWGPILTRGPTVRAFEKGVAAYCDAPFAVAFSSGTAALHAAYYAAEVGPFDRVLTSPNTFIGTVTGALLLGARVDFADVDPSTGNGDFIPPKPSSRGKAVLVPVHFAGSPLPLKPLSEPLLGESDLIIEDGCHAFGASYSEGKRVGSDPLAAMTVFSFHPAKTITTGEGGVVVTHHAHYVERLLSFRNNGITYSEGLHLVSAEAITGNFHMTEMQAALGLSQLKRTDEIVRRRGELYSYYKERLESLLPHSPHSSYHLCCLQHDFKGKRQEAMEKLKAAGIGTQIHYIPLYRQPVLKREPLPGCEAYYEKTLTLPLFYELKEEEIDRVVEALRKAIA
ncbi:MAG: DegT/DnrJ/EryC1/StrS family aminotransferase [Parachlamydiales bacterium]